MHILSQFIICTVFRCNANLTTKNIYSQSVPFREDFINYQFKVLYWQNNMYVNYWTFLIKWVGYSKCLAGKILCTLFPLVQFDVADWNRIFCPGLTVSSLVPATTSTLRLILTITRVAWAVPVSDQELLYLDLDLRPEKGTLFVYCGGGCCWIWE